MTYTCLLAAKSILYFNKLEIPCRCYMPLCSIRNLPGFWSRISHTHLGEHLRLAHTTKQNVCSIGGLSWASESRVPQDCPGFAAGSIEDLRALTVGLKRSEIHWGLEESPLEIITILLAFGLYWQIMVCFKLAIWRSQPLVLHTWHLFKWSSDVK